MIVEGMYGLGDNIYQRSILREVRGQVYLYTTWPQLYSDLERVKCVRPKTKLRTQLKNLNRQPDSVWHIAPSYPSVKMSYNSINLSNGTILGSMEKKIGVEPKIFDLPKFSELDIPRPYAVVRPVTVRSEWYNIARGPALEYICTASGILMNNGYHVVSVADIAEKEWCEQLPKCNTAFNNGELNFEKLMGLIQHAAVVVGGVGWIVPACIAAGVPLVTILGGQGGHNAPEKITGAPMNLEKTSFIRPDDYCMCTDTRHCCNKTITNFKEKFNEALKEVA